MKKVMLVVMLMMTVVMSGCTPATVDFMESMQVDGQHEKALEFLGDDKGTLVYKATPKAKECLRSKMVERGYYLIQDDIDCFDNEVR
ncbi:MAG: hypothetical protein WCT07_03305 [Candidatus Paceibacterota bacterium]